MIISLFAALLRGQLESCIQFQTLVQERCGLSGENSVEAHQDGQGLGQVPYSVEAEGPGLGPKAGPSRTMRRTPRRENQAAHSSVAGRKMTVSINLNKRSGNSPEVEEAVYGLIQSLHLEVCSSQLYKVVSYVI